MYGIIQSFQHPAHGSLHRDIIRSPISEISWKYPTRAAKDVSSTHSSHTSFTYFCLRCRISQGLPLKKSLAVRFGHESSGKKKKKNLYEEKKSRPININSFLIDHSFLLIAVRTTNSIHRLETLCKDSVTVFATWRQSPDKNKNKNKTLLVYMHVQDRINSISFCSFPPISLLYCLHWETRLVPIRLCLPLQPTFPLKRFGLFLP